MRWMLVCLVLFPLFAAHGQLHANAQANDHGSLAVSDAWVREVPAVSRHSAGYLTLENNTAEDRRLTAVESAEFERAMLHQTTLVDDMARMRHVGGIDVPAGGEVRLAPMGLHIMLMGRIPDTLVAGDTVHLTLTFDDGTELDVRAVVSRDAP